MPSVGSHVPQAKDSGSWKNWSKFWGKDGGTWKRPVSVHVKSGGAWVKVWDERPVVTNVSTYTFDFGTGVYFNNKDFTLATNGFVTTTSYYDGDVNGGTSTASYSSDTINAVSTTRLDYSPFTYPSVTVSNPSATFVV